MIINKVWIIIDAGGTYLKSAILQREGAICASSCFSVPSFSQGSLSQIKSAFVEVLSHGISYCQKGNLEMVGVGISIPGPFDYQKGISLMKHKYQSLYGFDMRTFLLSTGCLPVDIPIWFVHDVNAVLAGEMWKGNARSFKNVVTVTLGTGLGFACALNRKIQCSDLGSPLFTLYNKPFRAGLLEDYVSQRGFLRFYQKLTSVNCDALMTVKSLAEQALQGDSLSKQVFQKVATILAENMCSFLVEKQVECVLFGGQISRSFGLMARELQKQLSIVPSLKKIDVVSSIDYAAFWGTLSYYIKEK